MVVAGKAAHVAGLFGLLSVASPRLEGKCITYWPLFPGPNTGLDLECLLKGSYSQAVIKGAATQHGKGGVAPTQGWEITEKSRTGPC